MYARGPRHRPRRAARTRTRDRTGVRPAALEVGRAVGADIGWRRQHEVVGHMALDQRTVVGLTGAAALADDADAARGRGCRESRIPIGTDGSVRGTASTQR